MHGIVLPMTLTNDNASSRARSVVRSHSGVIIITWGLTSWSLVADAELRDGGILGLAWHDLFASSSRASIRARVWPEAGSSSKPGAVLRRIVDEIQVR